MSVAMTLFKAALMLTCIAGEASLPEQEDDEVSFLQASVQVSEAVKHPVDYDIDLPTTAGDYNLADSLGCANDGQDTTGPNVPASFIEPQASSTSLLKQPESGEPAGASTLRTILQFMIIALIFDTVRRLLLQKSETRKQQLCTPCSPAEAAVAAEAAKAEEAGALVAWAEMVKAASTADVASFEKALTSRPPAAHSDMWGCTALHFAAAGGSTAIATELLKRGVEVDALDANDETPLHFAARAGHAPLCELLLGAGAKMDAVNVQDRTPLVVAGHANEEPVCRLLTDAGAGVAGCSDEELPPLVVSQLVRKVFAAAA